MSTNTEGSQPSLFTPEGKPDPSVFSTEHNREGIRVGYLRLITAWPFPDEVIRKLAKQVRAFVVPEINMGQMGREVERCAGGQALVLGVNRPGGDILEAEPVLNAIRRAAGREVQPEERQRRVASPMAGGEEE